MIGEMDRIEQILDWIIMHGEGTKPISGCLRLSGAIKPLDALSFVLKLANCIISCMGLKRILAPLRSGHANIQLSLAFYNLSSPGYRTKAWI